MYLYLLKRHFLATALCLAHAATHAAPKLDANLGKDFSLTHGNPHGVWTYGALPAGANFTPFPATQISPDDMGQPVEVWLDPDTLSAMFHNANNVDVISNGGEGVHPPNSVWFGLITPGDLVVARYTAHNAGKVELRASFKLTSPSFHNDADIHVFVNGGEIFADVLHAANGSASFQIKLQLKPGDIVDFAAGNGADGAWGDSVFVDADIQKK